MGLFKGHMPDFFQYMHTLAVNADAARRQFLPFDED
jgi:hypothetical protein